MGSIVAAILAHLLSPGLSFMGILLSDFTTSILIVVLELLKETVLSPDTIGSSWWNLMNNGYLVIASLSAAVVLASMMWEALQIQQRNIFSVGPEDSYANLIGRAVWAMLMIASGPIFLRILIELNNVMVTTFDASFMHTMFQSLGLKQMYHEMMANPFKSNTPSLKSSISKVIGADLTIEVLAIITYLFLGFAYLGVAILLAWIILMWFGRQFELVLWGTLMPVALAISVSDPQRKLWEFVKTQLQGLIFQQAIMAFGIWLTISIRVQIDPVTRPGMYGSLQVLFSNLFTAIGFYYTIKLPKYWQQVNGHSSGGSEIAQIAAGSMLGRFGSQMFAATKGGQITKNVLGHYGENEKRRLNEHAGSTDQLSNVLGAAYGGKLKDRFQATAAGEKFNEWMETGTHDLNDDEYFGEDSEHEYPSPMHQKIAKGLKKTGKAAVRTAGATVDAASNPIGGLAHHLAYMNSYDQSEAKTLGEQNALHDTYAEAGTDIPDIRLEREAAAAEIQQQAYEDNPIAARAIRDVRNYQPPDSPDSPSLGGAPGPGAGPRPSASPGRPYGGGGGGSRGGGTRSTGSGSRSWQRSSSGLYTPRVTASPQHAETQTMDTSQPDLLLDTNGDILDPHYNGGDPSNSAATVAAWKAAHPETDAETAADSNTASDDGGGYDMTVPLPSDADAVPDRDEDRDENYFDDSL